MTSNNPKPPQCCDLPLQKFDGVVAWAYCTNNIHVVVALIKCWAYCANNIDVVVEGRSFMLARTQLYLRSE